MSDNFLDNYKRDDYVRDKYVIAYYEERGRIPLKFYEDNFSCEYRPKIDGPYKDLNIDFVMKKGYTSSDEEYAEIVRSRINRFENAGFAERLTGQKTFMDGVFGSTKKSKDETIIMILLLIGSIFLAKTCM